MSPQLKYYWDHRDEILNRRHTELYRGQSSRRARIWRSKNIDKHRGYVKKNRIKTKLQVIQYYSPELKCIRCGFNNIKALSIDHINGDGRKHRELVGEGSTFYRWLKNNSFPSGFQVLCMNCNWIKRRENNENPIPNNLKISNNREYNRKYKKNLREKILRYYSNGEMKCLICGCPDIRTLSIDHIYGGGKQHVIKLRKMGLKLYEWLQKEKMPKGFRVLCMNCQFIVGRR